MSLLKYQSKVKYLFPQGFSQEQCFSNCEGITSLVRLQPLPKNSKSKIVKRGRKNFHGNTNFVPVLLKTFF